MTTHSDHPLESPARRGRPVQNYAEDTYKLHGKPKEPSACRQCGVVFHKGRWTWAPKPADAHGEWQKMTVLAAALQERYGIKAMMPTWQESVIL